MSSWVSVWGVENYVGDWPTWKWTQKALVSLNLSPKNRTNRKRRERQWQRQRNSSSCRHPYRHHLHHHTRDDHRHLKHHVYGGVADEVLWGPAVSCLMWPPPPCPLLYFFNFFACLLSRGKVNPWASISQNNLSNIKSFNMPNDNGASVTRTKLFYCSRSVISLSWVMAPSWQ